MATNIPNQAVAQDLQNAIDYYQAFGTLEGFQSSTGQDLRMDGAWGAQTRDQFGGDVLKSLEYSRDHWAALPDKKAKIGKLTDHLDKVIPVVAGAAALFPGVGTALSGALGSKAAGVLTGAAKFSNKAGVDLAAKLLATKAIPGFGKGALLAQLGSSLGAPGSKAMADIPGMLGYQAPPNMESHLNNGANFVQNASKPGQHLPENPANPLMAFPALGAQFQAAFGDQQTKNAAREFIERASGLEGWSGVLPQLSQMNSPAPVDGYGEVNGEPVFTSPEKQTFNPATSALQLAALSMLGKKLFEKKDAPPAPALTPVRETSSAPAYGGLLGLITNQHAMDDQRRRLAARGVL